jgi:hypothetical protein
MSFDSTSRSEDSRDELRSAIQARLELGPEYEPAIVDGFLERVDARIGAHVNQLVEEQERAANRASGHFWVAIGSLIAAVPLSGIASESGIAGLLAVWTMLAIINVAFALGRRRR